MSAATGLVRAVLIAAATGAAAFGLLVVFHPFAAPTTPTTIVTPADTSSADALHAQIETVRASLAKAEAALAEARKSAPASTPATSDAATREQIEMQIAAAMERRDLARRHAEAIREALKSNLSLSALPEIRDSVLIGGLLSQQVALEGQIALESARLKSNHPVMRALLAQRDSLARQIRDQAAGIATALDAEADIDDSQIDLLQGQQKPGAQTTTVAAARDTAGLEAQASAERAQLDTMMDAYFAMKPSPSVVTTAGAAASNPLSIANLAVIAIAAMAAIVFQIMLAVRRRRRAEEADFAAWDADRQQEPDLDATDDLDAEPDLPLRRAS